MAGQTFDRWFYETRAAEPNMAMTPLHEARAKLSIDGSTHLKVMGIGSQTLGALQRRQQLQSTPAWSVRKDLERQEAKVLELEKARALQAREISELRDELRRVNSLRERMAADMVKTIEGNDLRDRMARRSLEMERDRFARELSEARTEIERLRGARDGASVQAASSYWTADGGIVIPEIQRDEKGVVDVHSYPSASPGTMAGGLADLRMKRGSLGDPGIPKKKQPADSADKKPDPPPSEAMITKMLGVYEDLDRPSMTKVADLTGFDRDSKSFRAAWKVVIERAKKAGP